MSSLLQSPPYPSADLKKWSLELVEYLIRVQETDAVRPMAVQLEHRLNNPNRLEKAVQDGLVMYDPAIGLPVFSKNGAWYDFAGNPV